MIVLIIPLSAECEAGVSKLAYTLHKEKRKVSQTNSKELNRKHLDQQTGYRQHRVPTKK